MSKRRFSIWTLASKCLTGEAMSRQQNLPEPTNGRSPAQRGGGLPAARSPAAPPLHAAGPLDLTDNPGRDHWWRMLGTAVQRRIAEKVGNTIEWWAYCDPVERDRPYAVVLGVNGLAVTKPTVNDAGRPAQVLSVRRLTPSSMRHALVTQRPSNQSPGAGPAALGGGAPLGLSKDMSGFLGNLPPEAQARLQGPFVTGDQVEEADYFYTQTNQRLHVWCYLAGRRAVTFVSGHRDAPQGAPAHLASWQLICRIAEVTPR